MFKKSTALLLSLCLLVCSAAFAETAAVSVTDMKGRTITLNEPATRVLALTAAECEIICALGGESLLVGRGTWCNYPESILSLPAVSSGSETNIEEILSLNPQVVFMSTMDQTVESVRQLEENGIVVVVSENTDLKGTYYSIRMVGALIGKDAEAEALIAHMQSVFESISSQADKSGKTAYFEISALEWGALYTAGSNTFMHEIAAICGLENAFADLDAFAPISEEQILSRNPDYIIAAAGMPDAEAIISARAGWQDLKAVSNAQVFSIDADAISRPGPRLADAAMELFSLINNNQSNK